MKKIPLTPMLSGLLLVLTACPGPSAGITGEKGSVQLKNWPSSTTAAVTFVNLVNSTTVLEAKVTAEGGFEYRLPALANTDLKPVSQLLASGCTASPTTANLAPVKAIGKTDGGADFYPFAIDFPLDAPRLRVGDELLNYIGSFDVGWYYSDQDVTITCSGWSEALKFKKGLEPVGDEDHRRGGGRCQGGAADQPEFSEQRVQLLRRVQCLRSRSLVQL